MHCSQCHVAVAAIGVTLTTSSGTLAIFAAIPRASSAAFVTLIEHDPRKYFYSGASGEPDRLMRLYRLFVPNFWKMLCM